MFKIVYSPDYLVDIGQHVFPTLKYKLLYERLLEDKIITPDNLIQPPEALDSDLLLAHTPEYINKLKTGRLNYQEILTLELPYSKALVKASWQCAQGTILTCQWAVKEKIAVHLGGGFHHAFVDHGEGFCVLNDIAIGIKKVLKDRQIKKAIVIDCDLHQGNGTAAIFSKSREVFTFSIHQENSYPFFKPASHIDIGLENGAGDQEYLETLKQHIPKIIKDFKPDLILYVAGADPYERDQLGNLKLTMEGLRSRDSFILAQAEENDISCAIVLAGGYAFRVEDTVKIHYNTILTAYELYNNSYNLSQYKRS